MVRDMEIAKVKEPRLSYTRETVCFLPPSLHHLGSNICLEISTSQRKSLKMLRAPNLGMELKIQKLGTSLT